MIVGLFFAALLAAFAAGVRHVAATDGGKIVAALSGHSRPDPVALPPARVVTISWQRPRRPRSSLAAAA
ncbi:hypothetical protein [Sphingomicrobium astaxanthinifaciens]|uniref:hypothetical protein n=1 Tax=Sphingomicrobium astaxanthinifaciens TaxID=1227949 RepID=UPI001FCA6794|nr:hypothetical protein [Sphingomicrobium astaxanthinifaciens]MCJ7420229.1 hypothetical protein [Sphingomicrobium astaxanthinifaciens]